MAEQGAAQGKPEPHAADLAGDERLEQPLTETGHDPGPRIIHANQHVRAAHLRRNLDAPRPRSPGGQGIERVERIAEQVVDDDLQLRAIDHDARQALAAHLELHGTAAHAILQHIRYARAHHQRVGQLEPRALALVELAQPLQHPRCAPGLLARLAQGAGEAAIRRRRRFAHEFCGPHVRDQRRHWLIELVRQHGGELPGHGEAHRALQRRVLLADAPQRRVPLGRESSEEERGDAEREQRELHVEQRNRSRSEFERRHQRGLDQGNADHGPRHAVAQRNPGDGSKERIEQPHVSGGGERERQRYSRHRPETLEDELAPVVPQPLTQRRAVGPEQQQRRERNDAAELADPVARDRGPGVGAGELSGAHQDGDVARGGDPGRDGDGAREPRRRARCLNRSPKAATPQSPGGRSVDRGQICRGEGQHLPGRRPDVRPQLAREYRKGDKRRPVHPAPEEERHGHSGVGIPRRDARVRQRLDVAGPIEQPVQPQVAGTREPGLPPRPARGDTDPAGRGVIHGQGVHRCRRCRRCGRPLRAIP